MQANHSLKPFVKWAGGKTQILTSIRTKYPVENVVTKYAEPFVGGGAVLFDILNRYNFTDIYISDINRELIHTYVSIRDHINELVDELSRLENQYLPMSEETRKTMYYTKRERFNSLKLSNAMNTELAALFIFLNRTCFNGLYRVNTKGEFNVPQGSYKKPRICDEDNLRTISSALQRVIIICGDYKLSRQFIDSNTFAYFDPPYRPLSTTANFTAYTQGDFRDEQQVELAKFIDEMSAQGAWIVASNSDPMNTDESDDFFDILYAKHVITRIDATRTINSVASKRGCVRELLIVNN